MCLLGRDLPQLLQAEAVLLRLGILVERELADQPLRQRAARALGDHGVLGAQLDAALEVVGRLAVLADALVAGRDADDRTLLVVQHLGDRKLRIDLNAQFAGLLAEPAHEVAEAADIVAVIVHQRRHDEVGDAQHAGRTEEIEAVVRHLRLERRALLLPVRNERVEPDGIDHRAGKDMRADLGALLQHHDGDLAARARGQLLEVDRGGEAGGPGADDHHVAFHRFAWLGLCPIRCHRWSSAPVILRVR